MKFKSLNIFMIFFMLLGGTFPLRAWAKVPDSERPWNHWEENKKLNNIYDQTVDILLNSGYDRSVNGLKVGYIKPTFDLNKNQALLILPVENRTDEVSGSIEFFSKKIAEKTAQTLKETGLFSSVLMDEKEGKADLKLQIYLRAMVGKNCLWGLELYDGKTGEKLMSGFDKVSTAARDFTYGIFINSLADPSPAEYFLENIPRRATFFIGRNNDQFNRDYFESLRRKSPRGY